VTLVCGTWCAHFVMAQGSGRLSALTCTSRRQRAQKLRTRTSPAGDSLVAGEAQGQDSTHWSNAPVTLTPPPALVGRRDKGFCGMPREWTVQFAGESAIVPTYRNRAAPFGGADCPSRTCDPSSGRTCDHDNAKVCGLCCMCHGFGN